MRVKRMEIDDEGREVEVEVEAASGAPTATESPYPDEWQPMWLRELKK